MADNIEYEHESMQCLAALMEAAKLVDQAVRYLASAPDADMITKNAIEDERERISHQLDAITRRLDAMPTWKPNATPTS